MLTAKNKQRDIEKMTKGQKRPEWAIPWEPKLHTKKKTWIQKQNQQAQNKVMPKTTKINHDYQQDLIKFVSKVLTSFAIF